MQDAPPLTSALATGRYHIKWTRVADLPVPLNEAYIAVQDNKIYVAGGSSPVEDAYHQVYVYDLNTDHWSQLPPPGHYYGIPHIIGGKLAIIGGRLSATKKRTNKVSTFDEDSQTWISYHPDLLEVRSKPGVVSHLEHVIVAGGARSSTEDDETIVIQDDIEILNWIENAHWRKVIIKLPVPMFAFTPTICDNHVIISYTPMRVGQIWRAGVYQLPVADIITSTDQQNLISKLLWPTKWAKLPSVGFFDIAIALVHNSFLPVVVGTADIKMYQSFYRSWKKIGSFSFARFKAATTTVYNNAVVVIGGHTEWAESSSLTVVELGQAELLQ